MDYRIQSSALLMTIVVSTLLFSSVEPAAACGTNGICCKPGGIVCWKCVGGGSSFTLRRSGSSSTGPVNVSVTDTGAGNGPAILLSVPGRTAASSGGSCAAGIAVRGVPIGLPLSESEFPDMIESVKGVTVVRRSTGAAITEFRGFVPSEATTESFHAIIPSPDLPETLRWYGFHSEVDGTIEPDVEIDFVFEIQLNQDACRKWKKEWKSKKCKRRISEALSFALIGYDASNADGTLAFRHPGFQTISNPRERAHRPTPGPYLVNRR